MRDEYGDLVLSYEGEEIKKCTYVGGESENNRFPTALVVSLLSILALIICVIIGFCYCSKRGGGGCCVTAE